MSVDEILNRPVHEASRSSLGLRTGPPGHRLEVEMPLLWTVVRDLQPGEEGRLNQGDVGVKPIPLAKVREIHHQIARLLAQGLRPVEVSAIVGFSQSRISILKRDPSFIELMAFYRDRKDEIGADIAARLSAMTLDAMVTLHERIVDRPEEVTTDELQRAVNSGLDRLGHGTRSTVEVNFIGASTINRLKAAATEEGSINIRQEGQHQDSPTGTVIEVSPEDIVPGPGSSDQVRRDSGSSSESQDPSPDRDPPGGPPI